MVFVEPLLYRSIEMPIKFSFVCVPNRPCRFEFLAPCLANELGRVDAFNISQPYGSIQTTIVL